MSPDETHAATEGPLYRFTDAQPLVSDFADDPDMAQLVDLFVSQLPQRVAAVRHALEEGDEQLLKALAHQLRGSAGGYGFQPITHAAATVENDVKEHVDLDELKASVDELVTLCRRATLPDPTDPPPPTAA